MYTVKKVGDKRIIKGTYIPEGHTCKCKECSFTIEVPECTTDQKIKEIVKLITG